MDDVKWIKVVTDIFDNDKMKMIDAMPDRDAVIVIWFKLLCLAGKKNENGNLRFTDEIAYTDEMLANYFNRPLETVRMALRVFEKFEMIEVIDDVICLSNWEKYQNVDGLAKIREQTRNRVAKHREQKKIGCNVTRNVTVTDGNATDKDIDKEIDKDNKTIGRYFEDDELNEAFKAYIAYRKQIKKPMTDRAIQLAVDKLADMAKDDRTRTEIVNQSILNGWAGLFPIKDDKTNQKPNNKFHNFEERKTDLDSDVMDNFEELFK